MENAMNVEEKKDLNRELVCVLFPGIVKNEEKAVQCLGGIKSISQVYSQPSKKRLGLCYQPENPFKKKIFADFVNTAGVLLKVKVKKIKAGDEVKREVLSTSVLGRVKKIYKFESLCDFQYLPVHRGDGASAPMQCILDELLPTGTDSVNFMIEPSQLLIVPSNFTRSDRPTNYAYTDKRYPLTDRTSPDKDDDVHNRLRVDRGLPVTRYKFNLNDDLPTEPQALHIAQKNNKLTVFPNLEDELQIVKKLFEKRPIMSQNWIKYHTKIRSSSLKVILPCLSIYMKNGPWRMLWVRYGYDPRKDPVARKYQTLDFRLRHQAGVHSMVMTRDQEIHYKKADRVRHLKRVPTQEPAAAEDVSEGAVFFRPGMAPTQRQIFYQYCDVKLPEVEEILLAEPPPGYLCHQNRGWLAPNVAQLCRDHIFRYVKETLLQTNVADHKFEDESSDGESNSDDEVNDDIDEASNSNT